MVRSMADPVSGAEVWTLESSGEPGGEGVGGSSSMIIIRVIGCFSIQKTDANVM